MTAVARMIGERRPTPSGLVGLSSAFDATLSSPSIDDGHDPQLSRAALVHWQRTIAAVCDPADGAMSPIFADLTGLPPMLLLTGGDEAWRDDSVRMAAKLHQCGVTVELRVVEGMWHVWPMWGEFPEATEAFKAIADHLRSTRSDPTSLSTNARSSSA